MQQTLVIGELIAAQESAQQTDGDLEILYFNIFVEREVLSNEFAGFGGLFIQTHQDHGVERVHWRHI